MVSPDATAPPENLVEPESLAVYQAQHQAVWRKLIRCRESLNIVRAVTSFPLDRFISIDDVGFFWLTLVNNCRDAAALSLNSLLNDSSGLNLSLRRTTNAILKWIKPDYAEWYREKLSATRFDSDLRAIAKRVRSVRNKVIAHSEWEPNSETPTVAPLVTDADLERLYTGAVSLFRACSLTAEYVIDIQDYAVTPTRPRAIDRYLALIARESAYLRQPEQRGDWWASTRNHLPPGSLDELNRWRAEFGLPPA